MCISIFIGGDTSAYIDPSTVDDPVFSPQKLSSKALKDKQQSLTVSSADSNNSSSLSSSSSSSESDVTSADSELERNHELMKKEYRKYLQDPKDVRTTNAILSNSF